MWPGERFLMRGKKSCSQDQRHWRELLQGASGKKRDIMHALPRDLRGKREGPIRREVPNAIEEGGKKWGGERKKKIGNQIREPGVHKGGGGPWVPSLGDGRAKLGNYKKGGNPKAKETLFTLEKEK